MLILLYSFAHLKDSVHKRGTFSSAKVSYVEQVIVHQQSFSDSHTLLDLPNDLVKQLKCSCALQKKKKCSQFLRTPKRGQMHYQKNNCNYNSLIYIPVFSSKWSAGFRRISVVLKRFDHINLVCIRSVHCPIQYRQACLSKSGMKVRGSFDCRTMRWWSSGS